MSEWDGLLDKRFELGGRGPDTFDCYGLVQEIYRRQGIQVPDYATPESGPLIAALIAMELRLWEKVDPQAGAMAVFRIPGSLHVGYCLSSHEFIHVWEGSNCVIRERLNLWKPRLIGCYRYVG
ncbi:C40 family peptidase [Ectothiorhodospira shaposhnikovii]|uniref:C40 family peptidase n=1 Tax=Ectothiorhodospira shaposhnikovii TaxID=1054 RepID=UPI001EE8CBE3|nr:NlpC/P60 family protein [Ectothiorhodospira shaposhnikovii]MCG5512865.1 C40 family peptidase [Ectothiorhodospira shaposhnikovii]